MYIDFTKVDLLATMGFEICYLDGEEYTPYICPKYRDDVVILKGEPYDCEELLAQEFFNKLVGSVFNVAF